MKKLIPLIDAICDAYDNPHFIPKDGITHCNEAVHFIADAMGCKDLYLKTADEIITFIEANPDWTEIPFEKAQDIASAGSLVVGGLTSQELGQEHGHVVIIRPGTPCYSGKWGLTPRCLNIGAVNFIAKAKSGPLIGMPCGLNEAFVPMPKLFLWRPSL